MPTLNWIGKEAVVKHHKDVPFRLLEHVSEPSCGPANSGNLIVQGDNLHALKALLPRYAGQVKCIYIDPPYNTGNEGWAYNDINSPEIRRWLGDVVGKEEEADQVVHDLPRLTAAETALFDELRDNRIRKGLRLEQERVGFEWLKKILERITGNSYP